MEVKFLLKWMFSWRRRSRFSWRSRFLQEEVLLEEPLESNRTSWSSSHQVELAE